MSKLKGLNDLTEANLKTFIEELIEDAERDFLNRVFCGEISINTLLEES